MTPEETNIFDLPEIKQIREKQAETKNMVVIPAEERTDLTMPDNLMTPDEAPPLKLRINEMRHYHRLLPHFIVAYATSRTVTEACKKIRMTTHWWKNLSDEVREEALYLGDELRMDSIEAAREVLGRGVLDAAVRKMELVNSADERVADRASSDVLNRVLGKPGMNSNTNIHVEIESNLPFIGKHEKKGKA